MWHLANTGVTVAQLPPRVLVNPDIQHTVCLILAVTVTLHSYCLKRTTLQQQQQQHICVDVGMMMSGCQTTLVEVVWTVVLDWTMNLPMEVTHVYLAVLEIYATTIHSLKVRLKQ